MKCIKCSKRADFIFLFAGTGGSYCIEHLTRAQERQAEISADLREKMDEIQKKYDRNVAEE